MVVFPVKFHGCICVHEKNTEIIILTSKSNSPVTESNIFRGKKYPATTKLKLTGKSRLKCERETRKTKIYSTKKEDAQLPPCSALPARPYLRRSVTLRAASSPLPADPMGACGFRCGFPDAAAAVSPEALSLRRGGEPRPPLPPLYRRRQALRLQSSKTCQTLSLS